ncbi:MAG: DUF4349 domain-containing protein [Thermoleophilaceae bacterium]|nr:DUF4349 domain-containing protein [Thermoleophilaceae bacterium]
MKFRHAQNEPEVLDPKVERELALVDALLSDEVIVHTAPDDLRTIVAELRAVAPRPNDAFKNRLDRSVEAGFSDQKRRGFGTNVVAPTPPNGGRPWLAIGSVCATVLVAAVGVTAVMRDGESTSGSVAAVSPSAPPVIPQAEERLPSSNTTTNTTLGSGPGSSTPMRSDSTKRAMQFAPPTTKDSTDRKQTRNGDLQLVTKPEDVEDRADDVIATVDRYRGFVQQSSVTGGDAGRAEASFDLRLPAAQFAPALRELSSIAHVRARNQQVQDVTNSYDRRKTNLVDARAQRAGLLKALAAANTTQEIESIRLRLRDVNRRIERADKSLARLNQRINFVQLAVTISGEQDANGSWSLGDAASDAVKVLTVMLGGLMIGAVVVAPFALIGLVAVLVRRRRLRVARERVLDGLTE